MKCRNGGESMKKRMIVILTLIAIILAIIPAQLGFAANDTGPWTMMFDPQIQLRMWH